MDYKPFEQIHFVSKREGEADIHFTFSDLLRALNRSGTTDPYPGDMHNMTALMDRLDYCTAMSQFSASVECESCRELRAENKQLERDIEMWANMVMR